MRMYRLGAFFVSLLLIPSTAFAFVVEFDRVRGNNNWVETDARPVDNDGAITAVDARVNGGTWQNLPRTTWGSYARNMPVSTV